ncbi:putative tyrosine phosphatase type IVA 3 [Babesia bovis T2Bo]|uniref:protein-tyrosine-phosphatase n=1 Tax=Babesia bovis TaxID=5865 RepID=A7ASJ9_BABBO|nr:putative tyrosine phosphatase type IVA 3 [Babesia bovis T2Bo]EDO07518.1 putative tyrosine phosphatase type IVA 3 [Babesia bovis T2Bo]BAN65452.1 tyrosine phosphatase, putative [Babesia bovis]|eukprot:XP_001611086.1 tyrosine phosphatase [Babesia bovis T2Bo]
MKGSQSSHSYVLNKPTKIEFHKLRILILDAPNNSNVKLYLHEMLDFGVTYLVRTCETNYDDSAIIEENIAIKELIFNDGEPPSDEIVAEWLKLVKEVVASNGSVAVHCVAGLGRAPVLACIALVEYGMHPLDAICFVRERRKGAINRKQLEFLKSYKKRKNTGSCMRFCPVM